MEKPIMPALIGDVMEWLKTQPEWDEVSGEYNIMSIYKPVIHVDYVKDGFMACRKGSLSDFLYTVAADSRIIGNIHDNPELVKGGVV